MTTDCLFCRIAASEIDVEKTAENEEFVAFKDIHPRAPIHVLIVPKEHVLKSAAEITAKTAPMIGRLFLFAKSLAEQLGVAEDGYRLTFNVRAHGGQTVDHLHLHLLAGAPLGPEAQPQLP